MASDLTLFTARWVVLDSERVLPEAGVLVRRGRVVRIHAAPRRATARRRVHLEGAALTPGLVNAHAHLELCGMAGRVPAGESFVDWLRGLVEARRRETERDLQAAARRGADLLLASGCTTVGDIDTTGAAGAVLARHPLRAVVYRELLDLGDATRRRALLAALARSPGPRRRTRPGLSPHAPYTVSPELLDAAARLSAAGRLPVAVHWAETSEERLWLEQGEGPFAQLFPRSPRRAGLELVGAAGLLGSRLALVHGNDPREGELTRIAAAGASVVHCPGTHAFFDRPPFPVHAYRRVGIPLALGSDSLASNSALDMRRELALARRAFPELDPATIWGWASEGGARALGLAGRVGALRPGMQADLVAWSTSARSPGDLWDELTSAQPGVVGVWIGGRPPGAGRGRGARWRPAG